RLGTGSPVAAERDVLLEVTGRDVEDGAAADDRPATGDAAQAALGAIATAAADRLVGDELAGGDVVGTGSSVDGAAEGESGLPPLVWAGGLTPGAAPGNMPDEGAAPDIEGYRQVGREAERPAGARDGPAPSISPARTLAAPLPTDGLVLVEPAPRDGDG